MTGSSMLADLQQGIEQRDQHIELLQRQLTACYERGDYVGADTVSVRIVEVRDERREFSDAYEALQAGMASIKKFVENYRPAVNDE